MMLELAIALTAGWAGWKLGRNAIDDRVIAAFNKGFDAGQELAYRRLNARPIRLEELTDGDSPRAYDAALRPAIQSLGAPIRFPHTHRYPGGGDDRP